MSKTKKNAERERRIEMKIIVDADDPEEQTMGWYCNLERELQFPFTTTCVAAGAVSRWHRGDEEDRGF